MHTTSDYRVQFMKLTI